MFRGRGARHVALLLLAAGCSATSVTVTKAGGSAPLPDVNVVYTDAWSALSQADFDVFAGFDDVPPGLRGLGHCLEAIAEGRFLEAEPDLRLLASTAEDARVKRHASAIHSWVLFHLDRWVELVDLYGDDEDLCHLVPYARAFARAPPERLRFTATVARIPTSLEAADLPFLDVRLGDRTCRFLVDTGATLTMVRSDVAAAAGVRPLGEAAPIKTSTSKSLELPLAVIPCLQVGNAIFENHPCIIADEDDLTHRVLGLFAIVRIEGVLGWNAIRRLDVEIDFRALETTIREPVDRGSTQRNLFWLVRPIVRCQLAGGHTALAIADTGADSSSLREPFFQLPKEYRRLLVGNERKERQRIWGLGGSERLRGRRVRGLKVVLDDHLLEFRNLRSLRSWGSVVFVPLLQLGSDIARKGRVRVDFVNGRFDLNVSDHEDG